MARTTLAKKSPLGNKSSVYTAGAADVTMAAADAVNKNQFAAGGNDLVVAHNDGVAAATVTITSMADPEYGRTGDISAYSLAAGDIAVFGPFKRAGWKQSDGYVYLEASSADIKFGVLALP